MGEQIGRRLKIGDQVTRKFSKLAATQIDGGTSGFVSGTAQRIAYCAAYCLPIETGGKPECARVAIQANRSTSGQCQAFTHGPFRVTMARFYGIQVMETGRFECMHPIYGVVPDSVVDLTRKASSSF